MTAEKHERLNIVAFTCHWGSFPSLRGESIDSSANIRLVRLMCGGRVSTGLIFRAFQNGADGVAVIACQEEKCHYGFGAANCTQELELTKKMTYLLGLADERLGYLTVHPGDVEEARKGFAEFVKGVKKKGKLNVRAEEG